jgi:hypothetical protein
VAWSPEFRKTLDDPQPLGKPAGYLPASHVAENVAWVFFADISPV